MMICTIFISISRKECIFLNMNYKTSQNITGTYIWKSSNFCVSFNSLCHLCLTLSSLIFIQNSLFSLSAYHVMGDELVFFRPVEKVGTIIDILHSCRYSTFPIVDKDDNSVLFGTIGRNALCVLLRKRVFGHPINTEGSTSTRSILSNYLEHDGRRYSPLVEWETVEGSYPKFPKVEDIRLTAHERECFID